MPAGPNLYYVYVKWDPDNSPSNGAILGRWLITCESRQTADRFFRALKDLTVTGGVPWMRLKRNTPQFWTFAPTDCPSTLQPRSIELLGLLANPLLAADYNAPMTALTSKVPTFNSVLSITLLPNRYTQQLLVVVVAVELGERGCMLTDTCSNSGVPITPFQPLTVGPDWLSDGSFFVRNKRQHELYWAIAMSENVYVNVSQTHRTKFRITGRNLKPGDVMIPEDDVIITLAEKQCTSCGGTCGCSSGPRTIYVSINNSLLTISNSSPPPMRFGDFFGVFGTVWDDTKISVFQNDPVGAAQYVTYGEVDLGDEWELC